MEPLAAILAILMIAWVATSAYRRGLREASPAGSESNELLHWPSTGGFDIHAFAEMADAEVLTKLAEAPDAGTSPIYATATLRVEPGAGSDKSAVSVLIADRHAAYLSSADAADYRARLNELGLPQIQTTCDAVVRALRARQGRPPQILVQLDLDLACKPSPEVMVK